MKSGGILSTIIGLILIAAFVAAAKLFNWDIIAMGAWVLDKILSFISTVSDYFFNSETFRNIFSK